MTEIWNLKTLCRCCHADGSFSSLDSTCNFMGSIETFTEILNNVFDIHLQSPPIDVSNALCNECITHLLRGALFKKQVLECERKFGDYCKNELLQRTPVKIENDEDDSNFEYEMLTEADVDTKSESQDKEISTDEETTKKQGDSHSDDKILTEKSDVDTITEPQDSQISSEEEKSKKLDSKPKKCRVAKEKSSTYSCKSCMKSFTNIKLLRTHVSEEHKKVYPCSICNIKFKIRQRYEIHSYNHSICKNSTSRLSKMTLFECRMCTKSYNTLSMLISHVNIHTKKKVYICDLCNKEFLYKNILRKHILWHTGRNKQYMCETCGNSFNDMTNLIKHKITVHEKLRPFQCTICSKKFAAIKSLKAHETKHTNERPFECDLCPKKFSCTQYLAVHKRIHVKNKKKGNKRIEEVDKYVCKVCRMVFDHRGIYTTHLRSHDRGKYTCSICNVNFATNFSMKRHIENHMKIKKFSCDECEKKFMTEFKLNVHKRHHEPNERKEVETEKTRCDVCKKGFTDIEKHMYTHNNKRHQCNFCDKSYSERNTLHRHIKQCHDGRRYECDICGKSYVKTSSLKAHKMKVHNFSLTDEFKLKDLFEVNKSEEEKIK